MSANYWTVPGARYHCKINSQCNNSILVAKISIKSYFLIPYDFRSEIV